MCEHVYQRHKAACENYLPELVSKKHPAIDFAACQLFLLLFKATVYSLFLRAVQLYNVRVLESEQNYYRLVVGVY